MMESYTLTSDEMLTCRIIGNMRTINCRSHDVNKREKAPNYSQGDAWETDEYGVFGEYAFCKVNNIFFDPAVYPRKGSADCMFRLNGKKIRVDVKTTKHANGRLESREKKNDDVDYFVLAILDGNKVSFPGYYKASDFYDETNLRQTPYGPKYIVTQDQLLKWKDNEAGKNNFQG